MTTYLITGASRGIGRAIAGELASPDITLWLHGRNRAELEKTASIVHASGGTTKILVYDLAKQDGLEGFIDNIKNQRFNGIINNAGISIVKPVDTISLDEWERAMRVNVTAPFMISKTLLPHMKSGDSIVNILSIAALDGFANWSSYAATKFALEGFSQSVREETRARGIRVINVYPSATDTEIWDTVPGEWPREKMLDPAEVGRAVAYALTRPEGVLIEQIKLGDNRGRL